MSFPFEVLVYLSLPFVSEAPPPINPDIFLFLPPFFPALRRRYGYLSLERRFSLPRPNCLLSSIQLRLSGQFVNMRKNS